MTRRALDIVLAAGLLLVSAPLLALLWLAVRLESSGPGFYGGRRVGRAGREFRMWKFRSMVQDADRIGASITSGESDPRVTRMGRLLRRTKLDELPQLWNLLAGDVTLIGPRPEAPDIVARYTPEQRRVLEVTPGITGRTQILFSKVEADMQVPEGVDPADHYVATVLPGKIACDLEYIEHRGLLGDLRILLDTALLMLGRRPRQAPQ